MNYKKMSISETIAVNPVLSFFILTLVIGLIISGIIYTAKIDIFGSLFGILLFLVYLLCPAIVAALLFVMTEGKDHVSDFFSGLLRWRVGAQWYVVAVFLPIVVELLTIGAFAAISGGFPKGYVFSLLSWNIILDIVLSSIGLALGLGYVLPLLLKTNSPAVTTAITAVFLIVYRAVSLASNPNAIAMCIGLIALAFILVWMYDNARNSVFLMAILIFLFTFLPNQITYRIGVGSVLPIYLNKGLFVVGAAVLFLLYRYFSWDES